ncbi:uncharacterized protein LOC126891396 [Diabrotica virgifera virgifera]|uniref:Protein kinase domain-containing protein n=1 Tax=Diabrotica virgifera virgifera TaxID=50390 RepID=A0ABM5L264_DIAVI|nr:uncharacterized protein LOC126891396 [Diabrotica virgifera virgifera]
MPQVDVLYNALQKAKTDPLEINKNVTDFERYMNSVRNSIDDTIDQGSSLCVEPLPTKRLRKDNSPVDHRRASIEKEQERLQKLMQEMLFDDENSLFGDLYLSDHYSMKGSESSHSDSSFENVKKPKRQSVRAGRISAEGEGYFGTVYKALHKYENKNYAVKKLKSAQVSDAKKLKKIRNFEKVGYHPLIVKYIMEWEEEAEIYLMMQLSQTSLASF